jgi:hypothetical protein
VLVTGARFISYCSSIVVPGVFVEVHGVVNRQYRGSVSANALVALDGETLLRLDSGVCRAGWGRWFRGEFDAGSKLLQSALVDSMSDEDYERSIHEVLDSGEEIFKL